MNRIPTKWVDLLWELQEHDPSALLAGGAIRDLYCGRPIKDLDFWVFNGEAKFDFMKDYDYNAVGFNEYEEHKKHVREIDVIYEMTFEGQQINVILMRHTIHPMDLIQSFDFGLCQAAYDGYNFHLSPSFLYDFKHQCFTLMHGKTYEKSKERHQRFSERYQNWPMRLSGRAWLDYMLEKQEQELGHG
jgi:hypothetical protein